MIKIAICDDEKPAHYDVSRRIKTFFDNKELEYELVSFLDGDILISDLEKEIIDIVFLDVDMPNKNGLNVAEALRTIRSDFILIFLTAHDEYVFEAIQYQPFRYIRKNRIETEFDLALKEAVRICELNKDRHYFCRTDAGEIRINVGKIVYFETVKRRVQFHLLDGKEINATSTLTLKSALDALEDLGFVQIHSGCVVNIKYIKHYTRHEVTLESGQRLILSRPRWQDVKQRLSAYWRDRT